MEPDRKISTIDLDAIVDAHPPKKIAQLTESIGIRKANMPFLQMVALGFLAGVFISLGALLYTIVITDTTLGFGLNKWIGGISFSLGLILVVIGGAELFTGNNLLVMAWASRRIKTRQLLRNWIWVYLANFAGALAMVVAVWWAELYGNQDSKVMVTALSIAKHKVSLDFDVAFIRGVLCNVLVCLAVWLCYAAHTVSDKIFAIIFPVAAFVALGFEHSVANMYFIPAAIIHGAENVTLLGLLKNLLPVTLGNMIGGGLLVAGTYWLVYLRHEE